jgi:hypothetical protein
MKPIREPKETGTSAVGSWYQRIGEETTDREDSVHVLVNCSVCE